MGSLIYFNYPQNMSSQSKTTKKIKMSRKTTLAKIDQMRGEI